MAVLALTWKNTRSTTTASGFEIGHQAGQLGVQDQQTVGQVRAGVGLEHSGRPGRQTPVRLGAADQAVATARQTRVNAQYEHLFAG